MQTNTAMFVFTLHAHLFFDCRMYTGPQKSIPVLVNGLDGVTLALGN